MSIKNITNKINEHYVLYVLFFAIGFNYAKLYLPIMVVYFLLFGMVNILNKGIKKSFLILLTLYSLFILYTFLIGFDRMTLQYPLLLLTIILVKLFFLGYFFHYQAYEIKLNLLGFFLFGVFLFNIIIVIYSFSIGKYGYGLVINPLTNIESNSPGVSNALLVSFSYFYFLAVYKKVGFKLKIFSITIVALSFIGAIFLGGRTFFLLAGLLVVFYFLINLSPKNIIQFLFIISLLVIVIIYAYATNDSISSSMSFLLDRFSNQGLETTRFRHYIHGLEMIWQYPLGGFEVDTSIEDTHWFHNIFFDTARVAGWMPNLFFIGALIYTLKFVMYKNKQNNLHFPIAIFSAVFLLMQQGVILEGEYFQIVVLFLVSYTLIDSKVKFTDRGLND